jgi:hypothetical protein
LSVPGTNADSFTISTLTWYVALLNCANYKFYIGTVCSKGEIWVEKLKYLIKLL